MNQEQPYQARHRADNPTDRLPGSRADAASDAYIRHAIEHAPTPATANCIADAYQRHGPPFAIYLALDGVDKYVRDYGPDQPPQAATGPNGIESDFKAAYYGSFPDKEALIDDTIESFDWGIELTNLLDGHADLAQFVVFDRSAVYKFAADHYEVVEAEDELHVFWR